MSTDSTATLISAIKFPLNELGNAQRFEEEFKGRYIWTKATDWLTYQHGRWVRDLQKSVNRAMIYTIEVLETVPDEDAQKWAHKAGSSKVINGSLNIASGLKGLARNYAAFDRHPELFNCANGTYNLETGEFQQHDPADLLTKRSPVTFDPEATCPKFEKFISDVMAGKDSLRQFLQRAVGYTMSAYTNETAMFIPYGTGGTGKSQFLNVLRGVLGDYATGADSDMFIAKRGDVGQPFDMAGKDGIRALFASETREGKHLDQAKVKSMTGGDPIRACYKGKEAYEFTPQWKIWLACNDKPVVSAGDEAMWDRLKLIPFDVKFRNQPGQIKDIAQMLLKEESSGILNWCLKGYGLWKAEGLNYPKEITDAVADWRDSEDYLQRFFEEYTKPTDDKFKFVKRSDLFKRFTEWAKDSKEGRWLTEKQFVEQLERKGYESKQVKRADKSDRCWLNLALADPLAGFGHRVMEEMNVDDLLGPATSGKSTYRPKLMSVAGQ